MIVPGFARWDETEHPSILGFLGQAFGTAGRKAEALAVLRELTELQRLRYVSPFRFAMV